MTKSFTEIVVSTALMSVQLLEGNIASKKLGRVLVWLRLKQVAVGEWWKSI